jgi:hypothetical protein
MEFHLTENWWTRRFQNADTTSKSNVGKISLKTTAFLCVRKFWTVVIGARYFAASHAQPNLVITKLNSKAFVYLAAMVWGENVVCVTLVSKIPLEPSFSCETKLFLFSDQDVIEAKKLEVEKCTSVCKIKLACDHFCTARCNECLANRFHSVCVQRCKKTLICGHKYFHLTNSQLYLH